MWDGGVHVYQAQKIEAQRRSQTAKQPSKKQQRQTQYYWTSNPKTNEYERKIFYYIFLSDPHATELQAVSISLVVWDQVIVVENSDSKHCGVDADTQKEDADKAHHLVERTKTNHKRKLVSFFSLSCLNLVLVSRMFVWQNQHTSTSMQM